jgi:hypothetical protein
MSGTGTQNRCSFEGFRDGTCKFTWNGNEIPYIGRYDGHSWKKLGSRILDAQAVFPLSTEILASKRF